jgi:hypothetical protein
MQNRQISLSHFGYNNPEYQNYLIIENGRTNLFRICEKSFNANCRKTKIENVLLKDVIDAMFRQTQNYRDQSFLQKNILAGGKVFATEYDFRPNGYYSYFDKDVVNYDGTTYTLNKGGAMRNDGVDIQVLQMIQLAMDSMFVISMMVEWSKNILN